jgi:hypothetical protein
MCGEFRFASTAHPLSIKARSASEETIDTEPRLRVGL